MNKQERSWVWYDWANSAFSMLDAVVIQIFLADFILKNTVAESRALSIFGYASSIALAVVAILALVLGNIADFRGYKKKFFTTFLILAVTVTALMGFIPAGMWVVFMVLYILANVGFSGTNIFYDSFLTDVTTNDRMDRISAMGYGYGYIGGALAFIIGLIPYLLSQFGVVSFSFDTPVLLKFAFYVTAAWWLLFSIPMMKNAEQIHYVQPRPHPLRSSFKQLAETARKVSHYKYAVLFLVAFFFYIDGVHTIIKMASIFGKELITSSPIDINLVLLGTLLLVQFVAFPFAILFGKLAEKYSAKVMLLVGIVIYTIITIFSYFISAWWHFLVLGILVGTSQGGVQALSRSVFGRIIPKKHSAEFFGFFSIFGKVSAIIGPFLIAIINDLTGNPRIAILSLIALFIAGGLVLVRFPMDKAVDAVKDEQ
jgi:UMF1 family MFS transporter